MVLRVWTRNHRHQILLSVGNSLVVLLLVLIAWFIQERMRGVWQRMPPLFAGPIKVMALSSTHPGAVYVVTPRGTKIEDGATLLRRQPSSTDWDILSENFTHGDVQALAVAETDNHIRIYASLFNEGIIRSDDEGKTWKLINNGLLSFSIQSLVVDPQNPLVLYAGSGQQRACSRAWMVVIVGKILVAKSYSVYRRLL